MPKSDEKGTYEGEMEYGRYHGQGKYTFDGNTYVGHFVDGEFHGEGVLTIPNVGTYEGYWQNGKLANGGFVFPDKLQHKQIGQKEWNYCTRADPRFHSEIKDNIKYGDELRDITSHINVDALPKGCYDCIDGYYDEKKRAVFSYDDDKMLRMVDAEEAQWIKDNCRIGKGEIMC